MQRKLRFSLHVMAKPGRWHFWTPSKRVSEQKLRESVNAPGYDITLTITPHQQQSEPGETELELA
jgi:hypothetical protein